MIHTKLKIIINLFTFFLFDQKINLRIQILPLLTAPFRHNGLLFIIQVSALGEELHRFELTNKINIYFNRICFI